jgi:hypothetical protein
MATSKARGTSKILRKACFIADSSSSEDPSFARLAYSNLGQFVKPEGTERRSENLPVPP